MRNLKIYTSCSANPNTRFGAYAFFIYDNEAVVKCDGGWCTDTTTNRMELTALIEALKLVEHDDKVMFTTANSYILYLFKPKFRKSNLDLWDELDSLISKTGAKYFKPFDKISKIRLSLCKEKSREMFDSINNTVSTLKQYEEAKCRQ
jgi:ribonuclease HI